MFGAGALLNGGCAFGTLTRIAGGNFAFILMLPGAALGFVVATTLHMAPRRPCGGRHGAVTIFAVLLVARVAVRWQDGRMRP